MMEVDEEAVAVLASQQGTDDDGYDEVEEEEEAEDGAGEDPSASESEEDAEEEAEEFAAKEAGPYARPLISSTHQLNCRGRHQVTAVQLWFCP